MKNYSLRFVSNEIGLNKWTYPTFSILKLEVSYPMKKRNFLVVNNQPTNEYYNKILKYDKLNNKYNSKLNKNNKKG